MRRKSTIAAVVPLFIVLSSSVIVGDDVETGSYTLNVGTSTYSLNIVPGGEHDDEGPPTEVDPSTVIGVKVNVDTGSPNGTFIELVTCFEGEEETTFITEPAGGCWAWSSITGVTLKEISLGVPESGAEETTGTWRRRTS